MKHQTTKMIFLLWSIILLLALPNSGFCADAKVKESTEIDWRDYSQTMNEGRFQDKKIMLYFTVHSDLWCDKMARETFGDQQVVEYLNENFVMCKIDRDRFPTLAKKYKIDAMPTLWFLDSKGNGLTSTDGFMPPNQMHLILRFIHNEFYKENSFTDWKESLRDK